MPDANKDEKPVDTKQKLDIELVRWTKASVIVNGLLAAIALLAAAVSVISLRSTDLAAAHTEENQSAVMAVVPAASYGQPFLIKNAGGGPALDVQAWCVATNTSTWPTSLQITSSPDVTPIFPNSAFQANMSTNACGKDNNTAAKPVTDKNVTSFYAHLRFRLPWGEIKTEDFEYQYINTGWSSRSADKQRDDYASQIDASINY